MKKPLLGVAVAAVLPVTVGAQAVITGTVREDSTGRPLAGVEIIIAGKAPITTDAAGRYVISEVTPGNWSILARMVGYRPVRLLLRVSLGDTTWANVLLVASAQQLEPIEVRTSPEPAPGIGLREEFEERRKLGFGKFIDSTVLRANEHRRIPDLLRGIPGITLSLDPDWFCVHREKRPPDSCPRELYLLGRRGCYMSVYLDGRLISRSGMAAPPDLNRDFYVHELEGIEVYRSLAEVPGDFAGASAQCGVIVLWTRRAIP